MAVVIIQNASCHTPDDEIDEPSLTHEYTPNNRLRNRNHNNNAGTIANVHVNKNEKQDDHQRDFRDQVHDKERSPNHNAVGYGEHENRKIYTQGENSSENGEVYDHVNNRINDVRRNYVDRTPIHPMDHYI
ncbi:Hypothetical protein CINCED_3A020147 [Cinara cedri]|nr:Hypothetical protein CINCED_3A020147 [Cinara cedri]